MQTEPTWRQRLAARLLRFFWLHRGYPKHFDGAWQMGWNRRLCWLSGHPWLYVRSAHVAGPSAVECRRGRMCQRCDAFEDIEVRILEAPWKEPISLGVYAEE